MEEISSLNGVAQIAEVLTDLMPASTPANVYGFLEGAPPDRAGSS